jgi:glycosyltransferase involved in cell wall biosynthesis
MITIRNAINYLLKYIGLLSSFAAIVYALFIVIKTIISGIDVPGYASLIVIILLMGGFQLLALGIIGEYLGRIFTEVKDRPSYLIQDSTIDYADSNHEDEHKNDTKSKIKID